MRHEATAQLYLLFVPSYVILLRFDRVADDRRTTCAKFLIVELALFADFKPLSL